MDRPNLCKIFRRLASQKHDTDFEQHHIRGKYSVFAGKERQKPEAVRSCRLQRLRGYSAESVEKRLRAELIQAYGESHADREIGGIGRFPDADIKVHHQAAR